MRVSCFNTHVVDGSQRRARREAGHDTCVFRSSRRAKREKTFSLFDALFPKRSRSGDRGLIDRCDSTETRGNPRTTANGFGFGVHLGNRRATICNLWFKFLSCFFRPHEPAAAIAHAHICDACVRFVRDAVKQCVPPPRFALARSTRPLDLSRRGRRGRDAPAAPSKRRFAKKINISWFLNPAF
jgi:hypothetical protein